MRCPYCHLVLWIPVVGGDYDCRNCKTRWDVLNFKIKEYGWIRKGVGGWKDIPSGCLKVKDVYESDMSLL